MVEEGRRFELVEVVGSGGFGTVYRARFVGEGGFEKIVALKVLNQRLEDVDEVARRLRDEARMLGLLRHRAVVQVDRLTKLDGRWTIVMEYVEGRSVAQILEHAAVPPASAMEIVSEISGALHLAYNCMGPTGAPLRLLHRDIKPSNIQITPHGEVKVLDFGIARAEFGSREAETRSLAFGTLEYMSPERLDMQGDGPHADVYAVGVLLFEMLTGSNFGRTSARRDRHEARIQEAMTRLGEVEGLTDGLVEMLHAMLAWAPEERPTAGEVERCCVTLRAGLTSEPLRFWTERVVVPLLAAANASRGEQPAVVDGDQIGTILMERSQPRTPSGQETRWEKATPGAQPRGRLDPSPFPPSAITRETPLPTVLHAQAVADAPLHQATPPVEVEEEFAPLTDEVYAIPSPERGRKVLGLLIGLLLGTLALGIVATILRPDGPDAEGGGVTQVHPEIPEDGLNQSVAVVPATAPAEPPAPVTATERTDKVPVLPTTTSLPTGGVATGSKGAGGKSASATTKTASAPGVQVKVTIKGNIDTIEAQMIGGGHTYVVSGSGIVEPGTYGVSLRESTWSSWVQVNPLKISASDQASGITFQCHTVQQRCKRLTP